jgi:uncharacterized protein YjbJ (UPF0337 family)
MNNDELEGKAQALKGKIKQAAGDLISSPGLHDEGVSDELVGNAKDHLGQAKARVGAALEDVAAAIKK